MNARSTPRRRRVAVVALALVLLAGCSSGSTKASSTTIGSSGTTVATGSDTGSGSTTAGSAGTAKAVDVCALIDVAKAKALSGQDVTTAVPRTGLMGKEWGCGYSNDDSSLQFQVSVFEHDTSNTYDTVSSQSKNKTDVSGVGDKAFYDNDGTLYALRGDVLVQVNGLDSATTCATLAKAILADV